MQNIVDLLYVISIHTPTQGVTKSIIRYISPCLISIHTPTQGVTENVATEDDVRTISIHTPTQGVTLDWVTGRRDTLYFNPHSHAGSDDSPSVLLWVQLNFNPHSHAGSDENIATEDDVRTISIHTPTQGVTTGNQKWTMQ